MTDREKARRALLEAVELLLNGDVPGPLTGVRLVEVANVKRHRLTHDNPDIAASFKERARQLSAKYAPEVERLRIQNEELKSKSAAFGAEVDVLRERLALYASRIDQLVSERDSLLDSVRRGGNVLPFGRTAREDGR